MSKQFNVTGTCIPELHYMVYPENKLEAMMQFIEQGKYFTINRPRQYGKTTSLYLLSKLLKDREDYLVLKMSFEAMGEESYRSERSFIEEFFLQLERVLSAQNETDLLALLKERHSQVSSLGRFGAFISSMIILSARKVVLMVDEVDKSTNNQLFLDFLGILRSKFLLRSEGEDVTFQSVILAGVHDVKNLKLKIRPDEDQKFNSPWNIATELNVNFSFSFEEIQGMLIEYGREKSVKFDVPATANLLYYYTSGYPFLVSQLCKIVDEQLMSLSDSLWNEEMLETAVNLMLQQNNPNFESLIKNLENNPEVYDIVFDLIIEGHKKSFNRDHPTIALGVIYGIFKAENGQLKIHNRIYEQRIYNYMSSKIEINEDMEVYNSRSQFIESDGLLNFQKVLTKFQEFMKNEYSSRDESFVERNGRLLFLAFIKPIINGHGFDFKEVQISEEKRLDVVITYLNYRYVVELKIWHGQSAHEKGIEQLSDYLDRQNLEEGYLIIFDVNKGHSKEWKTEMISRDGKNIFAIWV